MSKATLRGLGMSSGIAIGPVYFFDATEPVPHFRVPRKKIDSEKRRLSKAFFQAKEHWEKSCERLSRLTAKEQIRILESYLVLLQDPTFIKLCEQYVEQGSINAEWAVELTGQQLSIHLAAESQNTSLKRREDIEAVTANILRQFGKKDPLLGLKKEKIKKSIFVAESLTPEMVAFLKRLGVLGFITRSGGPNSHSMILARALCIPAVCGVENIRETLTPGAQVILNGFEGTVFISPTSKELQSHRVLLNKHQLLEKLLLADAQKPAWTLDKKRICVEANVELPEEVPSLLKYGAEGIGLFRTESLFWNPARLPSSQKQQRLYNKVLREMKQRPVTFRTLDVSGDLWLGRHQTNPALGLRGIRFSLKEGTLLDNQLQALLQQKECRILLPMVTAMEELDAFYGFLKKAKEGLKKRGLPIAQKISVGVTIEVPAAGLITDFLSKRVDFFAIGSNDLIQYTLAMDRTNEQLNPHFSYCHPAILKLLFQIVQNSLKTKKPVYLCGELGGDPLFIPVLLGLGIRHFSMNPLSIPRAKKMIRSLSIKECRRWVQKLFHLPRATEVQKELEKIRLKLDMPWWAG